jgi:hypothetical protein
MRYLLLLVVFLSSVSHTDAQKGFELKENASAKKVEVLFDGKLLTAYTWFDSAEKPVLYPVKTISGVTVTRGFPVAPRPGERTDHPHHIGIWFNYESVNGLDFWNNSDAIPAERKPHYGSIRHQRIVSKSAKGSDARLVTLSHWVTPEGKVLMEETTTFHFLKQGKAFIIDRSCTLKAQEDVQFKDVKDGMLGMRLARSLEMPSTQQDKFIQADGKISSEAMASSEGVTGMYVNKEGIKGDAVWSTQSTWAMLSGDIAGRKVSIAMIDHPRNPGYPTYWHARGYGLFALNPLGRDVFSKGKEQFNFKLPKDSTASFNYRIIINDGEINASEVNKFEKAFTKK